jgi:hypothetical protein
MKESFEIREAAFLKNTRTKYFDHNILLFNKWREANSKLISRHYHIAGTPVKRP